MRSRIFWQIISKIFTIFGKENRLTYWKSRESVL